MAATDVTPLQYTLAYEAIKAAAGDQFKMHKPVIGKSESN